MDLKGTLSLLLIVFAFGTVVAAEEDPWDEAPLSAEAGFGEDDYLNYDFAYSSNGGDGERLLMTTGPGEVPTQYGGSELTQYSQYFSMDAPSGGGEVERYSLSREPTALYYAGSPSQPMTYSTYKSTYLGRNALWIQGASSWTQYAVCPLGAWLQLLAYSTGGGTANFYEIYPSNRLLYKSYYFYPGYNRLNFQADEVGKHVLLFVTNNQPSNVVIVDVSSSGWSPWPSYPSYPSYARVIVKSNWMKGFTVSVDGIHQFNDVSDGSLDGIATFTVSGNQYHTIKVSSVGFLKSYYRYFKSGYQYTLTM